VFQTFCTTRLIALAEHMDGIPVFGRFDVCGTNPACRLHRVIISATKYKRVVIPNLK